MGISYSGAECVECDELCTNCKYGHAAIRPGFAVSMTKVEKKIPLYKMTGHRAVFACPLPSACNVSYDYLDLDSDGAISLQELRECEDRISCTKWELSQWLRSLDLHESIAQSVRTLLSERNDVDDEFAAVAALARAADTTLLAGPGPAMHTTPTR